MKDIDIREWKEYVLEDLFDFVNSKAYHSKDVTEIQDRNSGINYVTRSKFNNGLKCRVVKRDDYVINPKGTISFGAENADFFYQPEEYITGNKMYYIDTRNISKKAGLFLKSILENAFTKNFSFTDGMVPDRIKKEKIKLPSKLNKKGEYEPDWQYMEDYIASTMKLSQENIDKLQNIIEHKQYVHTEHWLNFNCSDIFIAKNTGNILARDVEDGSGSTPYVTASGVNNGVFAHIDASKYDIIKGHCILIGGKTFTVTYQADDFVSNDSHNFVIRTNGYNISDLSYKYVVTVIRSYFGQKYLWNDAVTKDKFLGENIPLPVDSNGKPDWEYMENYMKKILEDAQSKLDKLTCC